MSCELVLQVEGVAHCWKNHREHSPSLRGYTFSRGFLPSWTCLTSWPCRAFSGPLAGRVLREVDSFKSGLAFSSRGQCMSACTFRDSLSLVDRFVWTWPFPVPLPWVFACWGNEPQIPSICTGGNRRENFSFLWSRSNCADTCRSEAHIVPVGIPSCCRDFLYPSSGSHQVGQEARRRRGRVLGWPGMILLIALQTHRKRAVSPTSIHL